jgi:uncharacterized protein (DUF58 family)
MAAVSVLVALYMSAPVGLTFLLIILLGFLLSFSATLTAKLTRAIKLTAGGDTPALFRGETACFTVTVYNHTILPVPDLQVRLFTPDGGELLRFSVAGKREHSFTVKFTAAHWGQYKLGVESVRMGDFLGAFSFSYPVDLTPEIISVFPNIAEIPADDEVFGGAVGAMWDNPQEETSTQNSLTFSGFPGYNHREYVPGDPVKRINRKLSAKRGVLMLRLDDENEIRSAKIVLSPLSEDDNLIREEAALEAVLGYARAFVSLDMTADVYVFDEVFTKHECKDEADIKELQTYFAGYKFIREDYLPEDGGAIIITAFDPPRFVCDGN